MIATCTACLRLSAMCRCIELRRELDELKIESKELDRQLLDAVGHKLQLSQQLEAWQVSSSSSSHFVVERHAHKVNGCS